MLHLIAFDNLKCDTGRAFLAQYQEGDLCVFTGNGWLVAAELPLRGDAFLLDSDAPAPAQPADLTIIDTDRFITLIAEHGPIASWYP